MKKRLSHIAAAVAATLLFGAVAGPLSAAAAAPEAVAVPAVVSAEENSRSTQRSALNTTSLKMSIEYNSPNPVSQLYLKTTAPYDAVYQWYSTNPGVATVSSNGVVTAVAPGSATIVANTYTGTLQCSVTVVSNVGSVTLSQSRMILEGIGGSGRLGATVNAANGSSVPVTWTSSNPAAATVDANGVVTAVGDGEATITATAATGRSATCKVYTGSRVAQLRIEDAQRAAEEKQADEEIETLVWVMVGGAVVLATVGAIAAMSD